MQDFRSYTGCIIRYTFTFLFVFCSLGFLFLFVSHTLFSHVKTFFIYCSLDSSLMESGQEISVEKRALRKDHLVTDPSRLSQSISLSFALAVFHLTALSPAPVKTFTIELLSSTSLCHFSSCKLFPLPCLPCSNTLILVMPGLRLIFPVCLIKT